MPARMDVCTQRRSVWTPDSTGACTTTYTTCTDTAWLSLRSSEYRREYYKIWSMLCCVYQHTQQEASDSPATYGTLQMCFDWLIEAVLTGERSWLSLFGLRSIFENVHINIIFILLPLTYSRSAFRVSCGQQFSLVFRWYFMFVWTGD